MNPDTVSRRHGSRQAAILNAVLMLQGITRREKLVLMWIAYGATADQSYDTLARASCCSRRYVIRIVRDLLKAGYLTRTTRGRSKTNVFAINVDKVRETAAARAWQREVRP